MGFRDDVRRLKEIQQANPHLSSRELQQLLDAEKQGANAEEYRQFFAPTALEPYVELLNRKIWKRGLDTLDGAVKNYIRIVGLQPEDVFGIYGEPDGDHGPLRIVYRDRPEYQEGRRRYRQAALDK